MMYEGGPILPVNTCNTHDCTKFMKYVDALTLESNFPNFEALGVKQVGIDIGMRSDNDFIAMVSHRSRQGQAMTYEEACVRHQKEDCARFRNSIALAAGRVATGVCPHQTMAERSNDRPGSAIALKPGGEAGRVCTNSNSPAMTHNNVTSQNNATMP